MIDTTMCILITYIFTGKTWFGTFLVKTKTKSV